MTSLHTLHPHPDQTSLLSSHAKHDGVLSGSSPLPVRLFQLHLGAQSFTLQPHLSYLLGSGPTDNIILHDQTLAVNQAQIRDGELTVLDGSKAQTLLNGALLEARKPIALRDGDQLQMGGQQIFRVQLLSADTSAALMQGTSAGLPPSSLPLPQRHETRESQAIVRTASPSNSTFLQQHSRVSEKDATGLTHPMGMAGVVSGVPYASQGFHDKDLDRVSPPGKVLAPGEAALLPSEAGTIIAGPQGLALKDDQLAPHTTHHLSAQPLGQQQQQPLMQQHTADDLRRAEAAALASEASRRAHAAMHAGQERHVLHGTSEPVQQPLAVIPAAESTLQHQQLQQALGASALSGVMAAGMDGQNGRWSPVQNQQSMSIAQPVAQPVQHVQHMQSQPDVGVLAMVPSVDNSSLGHSLQSSSGLSAGSSVLPPLGSSGFSGDKYSSSELAQILRDMLALGGGANGAPRLDAQTDARLPHLIGMFPPALRQRMGSAELKQWVRAAEEERALRLSMAQEQQQQSGVSGVGSMHESVSQQALGLTEQDLAYSMLSVASAEPLPAGVWPHPGGNRFDDAELARVLADMADVSGDSLSPSAKSQLPHMLRRLPSAYRSSFDSSDMRQWIQRARAQRTHRRQSTHDAADAAVLSETDLLYSLVGLPWQAEHKQAPLQQQQSSF